MVLFCNILIFFHNSHSILSFFHEKIYYLQPAPFTTVYRFTRPHNLVRQLYSMYPRCLLLDTIIGFEFTEDV